MSKLSELMYPYSLKNELAEAGGFDWRDEEFHFTVINRLPPGA